MSSIVIAGVGGMGREAAAWLGDLGHGARLIGFVDDDPDVVGTEVAGMPVLGDRSWLDDRDDVEVVLGIGAPAARATLLHHLDDRGIPVTGIVHPTAVVGPRTVLGAGVIVCPGVVLTCDVTVGRAAIVNFGALVGHDVTIGDNAFIAPGAHVAGGVRIGARADVGIGASIVQGITIGDDAVVGAGAVVVRDVADGVTVVGVPARPIRRRDGS